MYSGVIVSGRVGGQADAEREFEAADAFGVPIEPRAASAAEAAAAARPLVPLSIGGARLVPGSGGGGDEAASWGAMMARARVALDINWLETLKVCMLFSKLTWR